ALAVYEQENPSIMARRLIGLNEMLTYPKLIGVEGTPHYGISDKRSINAARENSLIPGDVNYFPPEASLLLDRLNLSFPATVDAGTVLAFHKEGLATRLWDSVAALEHDINEGANARERVV